MAFILSFQATSFCVTDDSIFYFIVRVCINPYALAFFFVETEYQKKQTELDASDLYFTGDEIKIDELLSKKSAHKYGSDEQKWTLQKDQEIQFGPFLLM